MVSANHRSQAARLGGKPGMTENAADEHCGFFRGHVQPHQAIGGVAEAVLEEVLVAGEEGGLLEAVQQRQNVVIPDADWRDVLADDPAVDAPGPQQVALVNGDFSSRMFTQPWGAQPGALGYRAELRGQASPLRSRRLCRFCLHPTAAG